MGSPKPEPIENRKIVQYTMDCEYVAVYNSIVEAIKMLGHGNVTSICDCLHKKTYSALGFIWRYENELPPTREEQYKVEQLDKDGNVMRRFISVKDALLSVGGKTNSSISLLNVFRALSSSTLRLKVIDGFFQFSLLMIFRF